MQRGACKSLKLSSDSPDGIPLEYSVMRHPTVSKAGKRPLLTDPMHSFTVSIYLASSSLGKTCTLWPLTGFDLNTNLLFRCPRPGQVFPRVRKSLSALPLILELQDLFYEVHYPRYVCLRYRYYYLIEKFGACQRYIKFTFSPRSFHFLVTGKHWQSRLERELRPKSSVLSHPIPSEEYHAGLLSVLLYPMTWRASGSQVLLSCPLLQHKIIFSEIGIVKNRSSCHYETYLPQLSVAIRRGQRFKQFTMSLRESSIQSERRAWQRAPYGLRF